VFIMLNRAFSFLDDAKNAKRLSLFIKAGRGLPVRLTLWGASMFQETKINVQSSFRGLSFSDKVWRCLERASHRKLSLGVADRRATLAMLQKTRETISIASDAAITRLIDKNPNCIQLARGSKDGGQFEGLLAILPLNREGVNALTNGTFEGTAPDPAFVCVPGEQPEALYVWLVYMPCTFGILLGAIADAIDPMSSKPCPMFSRAVSAHSLRLHRSAGFVPASGLYPACKSDVLVAMPKPEIPVARAQRSDVHVARTIEDIFKVFSVRSATYIAEQFCLYGEEFDGNDFCATHWLGTIDGDAAGCIRARFFDGFAKIERLAVRAEYRNSRLAYQLVRAALAHCQLKGYTKILGHSRLDLVRFWRVFGFKPIADRKAFAFANVQYTEIMADLAPLDGAIGLDVDPLVIIRPEGAWDRPGPFDYSESALDPRRTAMLEARTRTIGRQRISA
jgi:predicted GNAT family N-acyltransferase